MTRRPWWRTFCGILLSLIFIPLLVVQVDLAQIWVLLQSARAAFLLPAVAALMLAHLLRAWRWQYIMAPLRRLSFSSLLSALSIGAMANMLLPAHAGEVIRAYVLARKEHLSLLSCLATIVTERLADLLSLVCLVVVVLLSMDLSAQPPALGARLRLGGYVIGGLGVFLGGGLWLLATRTVQVLLLMQRLLAFLPAAWLARLSTALTAFAPGLQTFRGGWHVLLILALSGLQWVVLAVNNGLILHALGLHLPVHAIAVLVIVEILGVLLPSAPGFIGTYHAAVVAGLTLFGVPQEHALSAAVLIHAAFFFPYIFLGGGFLWWERLSLQDLRALPPSAPGD